MVCTSRDLFGVGLIPAVKRYFFSFYLLGEYFSQVLYFFEVYHNYSQVLFVVAFQDNVEAGDGEGLVVGLVIFTFLAEEAINCFKGCLLLKYFQKSSITKKSKETILKNLSGSSSTLIM